MKVNVSAGHNPDGQTACGAIGLLKESTENRVVVKELVKLFKAGKHTVYDCTENLGKSQGDVLRKVVAKDNAHAVD
jgi:N-acetylmuramoyl-L-alanine amidase